MVDVNTAFYIADKSEHIYKLDPCNAFRRDFVPKMTCKLQIADNVDNYPGLGSTKRGDMSLCSGLSDVVFVSWSGSEPISNGMTWSGSKSFATQVQGVTMTDMTFQVSPIMSGDLFPQKVPDMLLQRL